MHKHGKLGPLRDAGILQAQRQIMSFSHANPTTSLKIPEKPYRELRFCKNMDDDDDVPPMLVAADGSATAEVEGRLSAEMDGVNLTKVPITIISGTFGCCEA